MDVENVLTTYIQGVFRDKRYIIAFVVHFITRGIIFESGVCISIAGIQRKCVGHGSPQACFDSVASAFSGIHGDTSQPAFCEFGYLLVASIHIEGGGIGQQTVFQKRKVGTYFVIPSIFGFVAGSFMYLRYFGLDVAHVNHLVYHLQILVRRDGVYH